MLVDSHAHLGMEDFDDDLEDVMDRSLLESVLYTITVGINLDNSRKALAIANAHENIYASAGIHPHDADGTTGDMYDGIMQLTGHDKVVACGEMGLDFFKEYSSRESQLRCFGEQLEIASGIKKPVIIHDRDAHRETLEMLRPWKGRLSGVIHCFSGDYDMARKCIDMGFFISFPGTVTFAKSHGTRDVVRRLPLDSILVETDAPFLAPVPKRGKRNEPSYVVYTAQKIAEVKAVSFEKVCEATTANAFSLFGLGR